VAAASAGVQIPAHVALQFVRAGDGATWLAHQRAAYPFHVGRRLSICGDPAGMATVYLQCCSGGLFENDDVRLDIEAQADTLAHVCTSAATIVHSMRGTQARQSVNLIAERDSHLEYLPSSVILFPAARLVSVVDVRLHEGASVLTGEIVLAHDPQGTNRCFDSLHSTRSVRAETGVLVVRDRWRMHGETFAQSLPGITGPHRAQGTLFILRSRGNLAELLDRVRAVLPQHPRLYIGASRLPGACGVVVRALCGDEPLLLMAFRAVRDTVRALLPEAGTAAAVTSANALVQAAG
jgi:urease accessory protein